MPMVRAQGNAFLTRNRIRNETFDFFEQGMKRLVIGSWSTWWSFGCTWHWGRGHGTSS